MSTPHASVIISTYNQGHFIGQAIRSVLGQTWSNFELLIVDDGSTDNTRAVVASFDDARIRYLYQKNQERSAARNHGIERARGEVIAFLDADDLYLPHHLATLTTALEKLPECGLLAGGSVTVNSEGQIINFYYPWRAPEPTPDLASCLFRSPGYINAVLIRKSWLEQVGGFDVTMNRAEDRDLYARLALAGCPMAWTPAVVSVYRMHGQNSIRDAQAMRVGVQRFLDKVFAAADLPEAVLALKEKAYAAGYLSTAALAYAAGAVEQGQADLAQTVALDPTLIARTASQVMEGLIAFALTLTGIDVQTYFNAILSHWPAGVPCPHSLRQVLAHYAIAKMFQRYGVGDFAAVPPLWWAGVRRDLTWLRNRGVTSVAVRAWLQQLRPAAQSAVIPYLEGFTREQITEFARLAK